MVHTLSTDIRALERHLALPRRQHARDRRRDAVHRATPGVRRERPLDQPAPCRTPTRAPRRSTRSLDAHDLLRGARQGQRRGAGRRRSTAPSASASPASPRARARRSPSACCPAGCGSMPCSRSYWRRDLSSKSASTSSSRDEPNLQAALSRPRRARSSTKPSTPGTELFSCAGRGRRSSPAPLAGCCRRARRRPAARSPAPRRCPPASSAAARAPAAGARPAAPSRR